MAGGRKRSGAMALTLPLLCRPTFLLAARPKRTEGPPPPSQQGPPAPVLEPSVWRWSWCGRPASRRARRHPASMLPASPRYAVRQALLPVPLLLALRPPHAAQRLFIRQEKRAAQPGRTLRQRRPAAFEMLFHTCTAAICTVAWQAQPLPPRRAAPTPAPLRALAESCLAFQLSAT